MKDKILNSKIFKLDDTGKPIGVIDLFHLVSGERILSPSQRFIPSPSSSLTKLINSLAEEIGDYVYLSKHEVADSLKILEAYQDKRIEWFKKDLVEVLKKHHFTRKELDPQYKAFFKKAGKVIKKKPFFGMTKEKAFTEPFYKSILTVCLLSDLRSFTPFDRFSNDALLHYISYLLATCNIEKGEHEKIFSRIKKRLQRHKEIYDEGYTELRRMRLKDWLDPIKSLPV